MKGISLTMQIIIVVIVLLIAAMVVLTIFGGQMGGVAAQIQNWMTGVGQPSNISSCSQFGGGTGVCIDIAKVGQCKGAVSYMAPCPAGQVCCSKGI